MPELRSDLEQIRKRSRVPALAAAASIDGDLREIEAVGERVLRSKELVEINDKWQVGSCTKPMTSTLAGILIERGIIDWNTTIADVFESRQKEILSSLHKVTLEQLLSHHGGILTYPVELWTQALERKGTPLKQRTEFVRGVLLLPPESAPGSTYLYSNPGYAIAGHMLETCAKGDWETLLKTNVFNPLGMTTAGFGSPRINASTPQPSGHVRENRKTRSVEACAEWDSAPALGPGATVHCSIEDLLKFAISHAGTGSLLGDDVLQRLHRRYGASEYSSGWGVVQRDWGGGYVLTHGGSNWGWYASIWIAPFKKAAFVAATNIYMPAGHRACNDIINYMIARLLK